ncbi:MAG: CBS domain-containing protein [Desulfurivibrio sp.]|nr:CBS domain-containing protein [Desulfurivibrio sp.]MBU3936006.1 CBS domain-containing protein [Pseudomonadota bacterium]MBU4033849.1 CBS domain-containing protein [Pseudomonadota bacterium]MBU4117994.1 CBS domain-containing protein [Pseudomonadota bacterium]
MFITQHMTKNPVTIFPETTLPAVRDILRNGKFRHLPVVDTENHLVGIVTDRDLRSAAPSSVLSEDRIKECLSEFDQTPVSTIMSRTFFTLNPISTLDDALILLDREKIGALPVVDEEQRVIGMFSMRDLMRAYRRLFGLGERGSAMIVVEHDGKRKPLSRIAKVLEEHNIRFTRLIRTEADDTAPERIYLRVNTYNISAVHQALREAGFSMVLPGLPEFAT